MVAAGKPSMDDEPQPGLFISRVVPNAQTHAPLSRHSSRMTKIPMHEEFHIMIFRSVDISSPFACTQWNFQAIQAHCKSNRVGEASILPLQWHVRLKASLWAWQFLMFYSVPRAHREIWKSSVLTSVSPTSNSEPDLPPYPQWQTNPKTSSFPREPLMQWKHPWRFCRPTRWEFEVSAKPRRKDKCVWLENLWSILLHPFIIIPLRECLSCFVSLHSYTENTFPTQAIDIDTIRYVALLLLLISSQC